MTLLDRLEEDNGWSEKTCKQVVQKVLFFNLINRKNFFIIQLWQQSKTDTTQRKFHIFQQVRVQAHLKRIEFPVLILMMDRHFPLEKLGNTFLFLWKTGKIYAVISSIFLQCSKLVALCQTKLSTENTDIDGRLSSYASSFHFIWDHETNVSDL